MRVASENFPMTYETIKSELIQTAKRASDRGPGWAQESVVLREMRDKVNGQNQLDLDAEQMVLEG